MQENASRVSKLEIYCVTTVPKTVIYSAENRLEWDLYRRWNNSWLQAEECVKPIWQAGQSLLVVGSKLEIVSNLSS